ncbi:hypothetical protein BHE74_00034963, partial [Ensete ventricosum]
WIFYIEYLYCGYRCDMDEKKDEEESTMNEGEAAVTIAHAKQLIECGVQASDIGIITPYAAQVSLFPLSCSIVLASRKEHSVTRYHFPCFQVGFLSDHRRMNVAVTRARRQCCLVCDTDTVSHDNFLKRLIEYFEEHGEYSSASEYVS